MNDVDPTTRTRGRRLVPLLAGALAATGLGTVAASTAPALAADPTAPRTGLVAEYLFDETAGTVVHNSADGSSADGDPLDAALRGSGATWGSGALHLSGGAKGTGPWVELPDDLLKGDQQATITTEVRADASMLNTFHFLWNIGNDATSEYLFASLNCAYGRSTLVGIKKGGEQLVPAGRCAVPADRWVSLTAVVDGTTDTATLYADGVQIARATTALSPADITDQSLSTIGRAPYPDALFRGSLRSFRVYDRALSAGEVADVSAADAVASEASAAASALLDGFADRTVDGDVTLPTRGGAVAWASADPTLVSATGEVTQPPVGASSRTVALTATATVRGRSASRTYTYTVEPTAAPDADYGYAMVHFIEDSAGYAEKIYLDVSRGDDPTHWLPLNDGKPILASNLGTTGVRDPYLTYNPQSQTWYIIATDLRVFGGDNAGWGAWSSRGSRMLNVWESKDLVEWGPLRQLRVSPPEAGMSWAPEATWDPALGKFVVYWASTLWPSSDPNRTGGSYSRIVYGTTTDFTQDTFTYEGVMIDNPAGDTIDTTVLQDDGTTYRLSKDNGRTAQGIYMEKTTSPTWYLPGTSWTTVQSRIGAADHGAVEGPALFKDHDRDHWYLYVDVIPSTGYRPYETSDLSRGWTKVDTEATGFTMTPSTKHGGIVSLTKAQHDALLLGDVDALLTQEASTSTVAGTAPQLPATASVRLNDGTVTSAPVRWSSVPASAYAAPGSFTVTGTVAAIGDNLGTATGAGVPLTSSTDIDNELVARVTVTAAPTQPEPTTQPTTAPATTQPTTTPTTTPAAPAPVLAPAQLRAKVEGRVEAGDRPQLRLRFAGASTGSLVVTVRRGSSVRLTRTVAVGTRKLRLPRATKGRWTVQVTWAGDATSAPTSTQVRYRVRR